MNTAKFFNLAPDGARRSGTVIFALLWATLVDLLGSSAAAAVLGRAARRAARGVPGLTGFTIVRVDREYSYLLPSGFGRGGEQDPQLEALLLELRPLLQELTGNVALRRLGAISELRLWAAV